ncbi:MAG: site-2 protease family protein, partial [Acidobacteriota bacterium]
MSDIRRPVGPIEPEIVPADGDRVVTWRTPEGWTVTVPVAPPPPPPPPRVRWRLPILLFVATCLSTLLAQGPIYAAAVMAILLAHEMGHYLQARRYDVPASPPYFIPMPLTPLGTMGAVILMRPRSTTLKGLYNVAISGPLAGLL